MNNKVIEVLEYIGEKVGIAIDWSAENVWPQVAEFMSRYATYEIARSIVFIVGELVTIVIFACIWIMMSKSYKKKDGLWYYNDDITNGVLVCSVIVSFGLIALMICGVIDIVAWSIVPEMKFIETISELMNK